MSSTQEPRRTRVPRNSLSREAILAQAVAVLDEQGPGALTMRTLADRLGARPMALYTYFGSKDELLDAARDHVMAQLDAQHGDGDWAERLRSVGLGLFRLLVSHPALIHLFATRPLAGHEAADATEAHLRVLRDAGFDRVTAARAHLALLHHVLGAATWEVQLNAGRTSEETRERRRRALRDMPADRYPTLVDLAAELVTDAVGEQQFLFGLDVILDGLRARLNRGRGVGQSPG
ncbi:MAG: TetR/AcrR family transcriptional regulator [Nocardioidaceae bacterium]